MPRAKCGKSTERTVDFYLTECMSLRLQVPEAHLAAHACLPVVLRDA